MALTKETKDWLMITPDGVFEHRRTVSVFDDGELLGEKHHRTTIPPNTDKATLAPKLRAIADIVWTQAVIDAWNAKEAAAADALQQ